MSRNVRLYTLFLQRQLLIIIKSLRFGQLEGGGEWLQAFTEVLNINNSFDIRLAPVYWLYK